MKQVAIIDYASGNLHSACKAFERVANELSKEYAVWLITSASAIERADYVVLPGVGAFADCKKGLMAVPGMVEAITVHAKEKQKPFLGICVGMQLLAQKGLEHGEHEGLGWIAGEVVPIQANTKQLKIPHMGWNVLERRAKHPLREGITTENHAYFVHSYHMQCKDAANVMAITDYGGTITAVVAKDNIMGTQFHPEKSQQTGLRLIKNFLQS